MYGEGEWLEEKHGKRCRRRRRKLHLAIEANSHEVVAVELTSDEVGDATTVPDLVDPDRRLSRIGDRRWRL
jgi:hypothetical protein